MRADPGPTGSESALLEQCLDYQRETMLSKTAGLTREQLALRHAPSELTLAGLLYHLALVEEDWTEVRFSGLPDLEPWDGVDWDADPNWEFHTACDLGLGRSGRLKRSRYGRWPPCEVRVTHGTGRSATSSLQ